MEPAFGNIEACDKALDERAALKAKIEQLQAALDVIRRGSFQGCALTSQQMSVIAADALEVHCIPFGRTKR